MKPAFAARWLLAPAAAILAAQPLQARAEDLAEAIALAYESNPALLSQRAQLAAVNEQYVQAQAGFRPTINAQIAGAYAKAPQTSLFGGRAEVESNTGEAALTLSQPLYTGGRTTAQVDGAKAQIDSGREQLRQVEAQVLFDTIRAYSDVTRDRAILAVQRDSLKELRDAVDEIRARREAGAATVTDVSQADAQLQVSEALVASAQAQLEVSVAAYVAAVGRSPGDLAPPPPLPGVPVSIEDAMAAAGRESPAIRQARFAEAASSAQVREARSAFRPTVSINGHLGYTGAVEPFIRQDYLRDSALTLTFTQPIFTGDMIASRARQAQAQDSSALMQINASERSVIQGVSQAWSQRHAAELSSRADEAAVRSAREAYEGMREAYRAGLRQTLDVLVAEETLRDTRVSLASAQRDAYVDAAVLLQAVGRLEARQLVQGLPLYDPETDFRRVRGKGDVPTQVLPAALDRIGAPARSPAPPPPQPQGGADVSRVRIIGQPPSSGGAPAP